MKNHMNLRCEISTMKEEIDELKGVINKNRRLDRDKDNTLNDSQLLNLNISLNHSRQSSKLTTL